MADEIKVNPNPIQRNTNDVAIELTKLYLERFSVDGLEEIQEVYAKFHASAVLAQYTYADGSLELVPDNVKSAYSKGKR